MKLTEKESRHVKRMTYYKGVTLIVGASVLFSLSVVMLVSDPRRFLRFGLSTLLISVLWLIVGIIVVRRGRNPDSSAPPASSPK